MDKLSALISFTRSVDLGSFSAAAGHLGVSQPAVSQQVRALEESLGVRLLNRTTRSLSLTEAGEKYHAFAIDILSRLEEAERSVQSAEAQMSGRLAVGLPIGFSDSLLGEFLITFKTKYPNLILDVAISDAFVDLISAKLDVTLRAGIIRDDSLIVKKLGDVERCLVAAPDYLDRAGRPEHPADLTRMDYLLYKGIATGDLVTLTGPSGAKVSVDVTPTMFVNNALALHNACVRGLGISMAKRWQVEPLMASGVLEEVLPDWEYPSQPMHAVYPSNRYIPLKVKVFVEEMDGFLREIGAFATRSQRSPQPRSVSHSADSEG
ncbi:LysR substrate-binding domain-containing protein [Roseibium sp.]|uniref:LysR family transcriptional regulator n=1 Tax=Roseibium sp. TaxID=1936156 RepID=UPI003A97ACE6